MTGEGGNRIKSDKIYRARSIACCGLLPFSGCLFTSRVAHFVRSIEHRAKSIGHNSQVSMSKPYAPCSMPYAFYATDNGPLTTGAQIPFLLAINTAAISLPIKIQFFRFLYAFLPTLT